MLLIVHYLLNVAFLVKKTKHFLLLVQLIFL